MTNGQRDSSDRSSRDRLWMMMGATLNPNSSMADEMENVLKHEVQDHSVYDASMQPVHHQVPLPGGKRSQAGVSNWMLQLIISYLTLQIHLQLMASKTFIYFYVF